MSNKAKRDKASILAEVKELLKILLPAIQRMPKIERIEGAPNMMKVSAFDMIANFTRAYYDKENRRNFINDMIGDYARFQAAFEIAIQQGLLFDNTKVAIAFRMERIEEGIRKWQNSLASMRQEPRQVEP